MTKKQKFDGLTIDEAWEELVKLDKETEENLKPDEALFQNLGCYTVKKTEVDEIVAVISNSGEYPYVCSSNVDWFDSDSVDELHDDYNYEFPTGLFILKCWGHEHNSMTDCGIEYDYKFSRNYEITKIGNGDLLEILTEYLKQKETLENVECMIEECLDMLNISYYIQDGHIRRNIEDCVNGLNETIERLN